MQLDLKVHKEYQDRAEQVVRQDQAEQVVRQDLAEVQVHQV